MSSCNSGRVSDAAGLDAGGEATGRSGGYSLVELVFVCALVATLSGLAIPGTLTALDDYRTAAATRYLVLRMQQARKEAVRRSADVALRFVQTADGFTYALYVDGNRNGVRSQDILRGIDRPLGSEERLTNQFAGIDFGVLPDLPAIDGGSAPGSDPIKLGSSNLLSFSAAGTSSPGSVYIRGRHAQYVIRIFGETGRTRMLKFVASTRQWIQP